MRLVRTISWILTFVAVGAAAAAWFTPRPDVDADMAGEIALRALDAAGIEDATVRGTPQLGVHTRPDTPDGSPSTDSTATDSTAADSTAADSTEGPETQAPASVAEDAPSTTVADADESADQSEAIDVWIVIIEVGSDVIEMRVHDTEGQLVYVDDLVGENRDTRLLDDEQWATVSTYRDDEVDSWVDRNVAGAVAAGVIVVVGFLLAKRTDRVDQRTVSPDELTPTATRRSGRRPPLG